jgi:hypothetical protein
MPVAVSVFPDEIYGASALGPSSLKKLTDFLNAP